MLVDFNDAVSDSLGGAQGQCKTAIAALWVIVKMVACAVSSCLFAVYGMSFKLKRYTAENAYP